MKQERKNTKKEFITNYYDGKVFWDYDNRWNDIECDYPSCSNKAVGRVMSAKTNRNYENNYMFVCLKHLKEFIAKYTPDELDKFDNHLRGS